MQPTRSTDRHASPSSGTVSLVRLFGVPVRLHFTFVLLFVFLIVFGIESQSGLAIALYIGALFGSVLLHELGHALVAKRYGIRTLEIVMYPIGGVARLERSPRAREEFWIAIAGPAVNLVIAAGLFGFLLTQGPLEPMEGLGRATDANLLQRIAAGNLVLAMFNLLPAFPMDGGRILRSLLALKRGEDEATRMASRAGQWLAVAIGLYGLISMQFMLVFIAFFVYLGAAQEGWMARGRLLIAGTKASDAMVTDFRTLSHGNTIREAAELLLSTSQQDFPVLHGDQVVGLLNRSALVRALASEGPDSYVAAAMDREPLVLEPGADLAEALTKLTPATAALVMESGKLLGLLTTENLSELLVLRSVGLARRDG
ncbi:MAG: site-2 protease family protein [Bryobacteraceae bacterium]|nr:site-2 protease family protein [Bryobacteraceae bacterium]